jgi:hypothetical protein
MPKNCQTLVWFLLFGCLLFGFGFLVWQASGTGHLSSDDHPAEKITDIYIAVFSGLLVLVTGGLVWLGYQQFLDTRILQRGYIAVEPRGVVMLRQGDRLIGHVAVKNAGNLPAQNLGWFIDIKQSDNGKEAHFPLEDANGTIVVSPRTETIRGWHIVLSSLPNTGFEDADKHPTYLYVWGIVRYDDGFVSGRFTKFCHRYNWINRGREVENEKEIAAKYARDHEVGNEAS